MEFGSHNLMSSAGIDEASYFSKPDSSSSSRGSLGTVAAQQEIMNDLNDMFGGEDNQSMGQSTCGCASGCGCGDCQCMTGKGNESSNMFDDFVSMAMESVRSIGQSRPEFAELSQQIESELLEALAKPSAGAGKEKPKAEVGKA
jgi:hypothetical protein